MGNKRIVVAGASGFIGGHLVRALKAQGNEVHGIDVLPPLYERPEHYHPCDLRKAADTEFLFKEIGHVDEVYNLACLMGGMGFIGDPGHDYDIMVGSTQIVANVLECARMGHTDRSFFSSSACVYNMQKQVSPWASLKESDAYPAMPDLVYGWQKLFSEQMYLAAAGSKGMSVHIGRFHNVFGPEGAYDGGKEKAPAAICRKVALAKDGDEIEIWGSGEQTRSFLYIDECIDGIGRVMRSGYAGPFNIGSDASVSINILAGMIIDISGKKLTIKNVPGPVGVIGRNSNNLLIQDVIGWRPTGLLADGLKRTYEWINEQVKM